MDELDFDELRALRPARQEPSAAAVLQARTALQREMDKATTANSVSWGRAFRARAGMRGQLPRTVVGRRPLLGAATAAAAVAAVLIAVPHSDGPGSPRPHEGVGALGATTSPAGQIPAVSPQAVPHDAVGFLRTAARVSALTKDVYPRADQFLYVHDGSYVAWLSIDGMHDGAVPDSFGVLGVEPGCIDGVQRLPADNGVRSVPCTLNPAFLPDLPTTADAMPGWFARSVASTEINAIAKSVMELFRFHYLLASQRSALYEYMSSLAGLRITNDETNDRTTVTWDGGVTLLFDTVKQALVGIGNSPQSIQGLVVALVDHIGQRRE